jgi:hypothetical protein
VRARAFGFLQLVLAFLDPQRSRISLEREHRTEDTEGTDVPSPARLEPGKQNQLLKAERRTPNVERRTRNARSLLLFQVQIPLQFVEDIGEMKPGLKPTDDWQNNEKTGEQS